MVKTQYIAILRGINIGGNNLIKIITLPVYKNMTILNGNTTLKSLELMNL
jgi:hypothetical protein